MSLFIMTLNFYFIIELLKFIDILRNRKEYERSRLYYNDIDAKKYEYSL